MAELGERVQWLSQKDAEFDQAEEATSAAAFRNNRLLQ